MYETHKDLISLKEFSAKHPKIRMSTIQNLIYVNLSFTKNCCYKIGNRWFVYPSKILNFFDHVNKQTTPCASSTDYPTTNASSSDSPLPEPSLFSNSDIITLLKKAISLLEE